MTILPKAIYRFNTIPIKLSMAIFHRIRAKNFTVCMETQKTSNDQAILRKKNRLYYKATVIKKHGTGTKSEIQTNETG